MPLRWAEFYDCDGRALGAGGDDRQTLVARALLRGPVTACLERATPVVRARLRRGLDQVHVMLDRNVAPDPEHVAGVLEHEIEAAGLFGSYVRALDHRALNRNRKAGSDLRQVALGWDRGRAAGTAQDTTRHLRSFLTWSKRGTS